LAIFKELQGLRRVSLKKWYKVLGELSSMTLAIPGGRGLFSLLQSGLKHRDRYRIGITPAIRAQLDDFEYLARDLGSRPTSLSEIVPGMPAALGASDAAKSGMGGVWFPATTNSNLRLILWRSPFPADVQDALALTRNPTGAITNSNLELAGAIGNQDILVQEVACRGRTNAGLCDNVPAVVWHRKGSTTTAHLKPILHASWRFYAYNRAYFHA
jgi:hypothetical protein